MPENEKYLGMPGEPVMSSDLTGTLPVNTDEIIDYKIEGDPELYPGEVPPEEIIKDDVTESEDSSGTPTQPLLFDTYGSMTFPQPKDRTKGHPVHPPQASNVDFKPKQTDREVGKAAAYSD